MGVHQTKTAAPAGEVSLADGVFLECHPPQALGSPPNRFGKLGSEPKNPLRELSPGLGLRPKQRGLIRCCKEPHLPSPWGGQFLLFSSPSFLRTLAAFSSARLTPFIPFNLSVNFLSAHFFPQRLNAELGEGRICLPSEHPA